MENRSIPAAWRLAGERDSKTKPALSDPLPERRIARLLAAYIVAGLFFLVFPGTVLGVWNLLGISSQHALAKVSDSWIQAHGHAQFFGWFGSFIIGISLYALPKSQGSASRSMPSGWAIWTLWTGGVGLRWWLGLQAVVSPWGFRIAGALELAAGLMLLWQTSRRSGASRRQPWFEPIFAGLVALNFLLAWQMLLTLGNLKWPGLPADENRTLISLAIWAFAFPVELGYCGRFFPGLLGTSPPRSARLRAALTLAALAAVAFIVNGTRVAGAAAFGAAVLAAWSLGILAPPNGKPKLSGVYARYPLFARMAYGWLAISGLLGIEAARPGMLGASRHAFTVGFLATLIFAVGPRILPAFLNSRELWSVRLMRWPLWMLTGGCALRVISEPLAYGDVVAFAWKVLPVSAAFELTAVVLFAFNIAMSLATPIPSWFGRRNVNDKMSLYWLVTSYPATRRLLIRNGVTTLGSGVDIPKSLTLREAAEADSVSPESLIAVLGDFFEKRLPPSVRRASAKKE